LRSDGIRSIALVFGLAACEIEEVAIPRTEAQLAMHSVLSASARTQVVLLERTRNGSVALVLPPFDLADPIGHDEGIAERGAVVSLTTPSGETLSPQEDQRGGIYRFTLPGSALERGGKYSLFVLTTRGEALRAETSVPAGTVADVAIPRVFDRASDTVVIEWPLAAGARSYFVRIETPFGPMSFFTDSTRIRLTGALRNLGLQALPRVFFPGFPQAVTVSAVDSNYTTGTARTTIHSPEPDSSTASRVAWVSSALWCAFASRTSRSPRPWWSPRRAGSRLCLNSSRPRSSRASSSMSNRARRATTRPMR
jgi:hypothetical protein